MRAKERHGGAHGKRRGSAEKVPSSSSPGSAKERRPPGRGWTTSYRVSKSGVAIQAFSSRPVRFDDDRPAARPEDEHHAVEVSDLRVARHGARPRKLPKGRPGALAVLALARCRPRRWLTGNAGCVPLLDRTRVLSRQYGRHRTRPVRNPNERGAKNTCETKDIGQIQDRNPVPRTALMTGGKQKRDSIEFCLFFVL